MPTSFTKARGELIQQTKRDRFFNVIERKDKRYVLGIYKLTIERNFLTQRLHHSTQVKDRFAIKVDYQH